MHIIKHIHARQIIDSRGNPTIEAEVTLSDGSVGRAAVPSGASTGTHEALELRDKDDSKYLGQGVLQAIQNVHSELSQTLVGNSFDQSKLDISMIELDGTETKSRLGANAILAVSLAFAWAVANAEGIPLYKYIGSLYGNTTFTLPRPMFNIMNGGKHANWSTDIQEYIVMPIKENPWSEKVRIGCEIYLTLEKILKEKNYSTNVGNEGGFAPALESNKEALDLMVEAIEKAGYIIGEDIGIGFDAAASEFYNTQKGVYELKRDSVSKTSSQMVEWAEELMHQYPVISFEDFLAEDDWNGWGNLTAKVRAKAQVVGDDLLVTNVKRIQRAIEHQSCTALLVKVNQIGSLTETLSAMKMAENAGWKNVISHRSGETEDITIAHLVVGTNAGQFKTGAPSRGERTAKYNELIRIAEEVEK